MARFKKLVREKVGKEADRQGLEEDRINSPKKGHVLKMGAHA